MGSNGQAGSVTFSWGPLPVSSICFPAGTPVNTDQGIVPIQNLQTTVHTIGGKPIQHITRTLTIDPYLISFDAHALGNNYPSQTTIMTKDHHILYQGQLAPAHRFLDHSFNVKKVKYDGEVLYNVLLAQHSTMRVNNLVCETLHPENVIAKLFNSHISPAYKNNMVTIMNEALEKKDLQTYKTILNHF